MQDVRQRGRPAVQRLRLLCTIQLPFHPHPLHPQPSRMWHHHAARGQWAAGPGRDHHQQDQNSPAEWKCLCGEDEVCPQTTNLYDSISGTYPFLSLLISVCFFVNSVSLPYDHTYQHVFQYGIYTKLRSVLLPLSVTWHNVPGGIDTLWVRERQHLSMLTA